MIRHVGSKHQRALLEGKAKPVALAPRTNSTAFVEEGYRDTKMSLFGTDAYESVLFVARECFVYRIPPRKTTAGYKAAEWGDMEAFLWKGRLRIIEKGEECSIRLEDKDSGAFPSAHELKSEMYC